VGEAGVGQGLAQLGTAIALDVLDQDEDVGLLVEEGGEDCGWDGACPGLVADVERDDEHG